MSETSTIEWTDATWNPTRGCTKISPGCKHCYAETFAERFRGVPGHPYERGFDLRLVPDKLDAPLRWIKPKKIFVNSMSDLFHRDVPDDYIVKVTDVMARATWHTFQVLTKRSERLRDMLKGPLREFSRLKWIQWGVSVEDKKFGIPRIAHLQAAPAAVRILSIEPLLEDIGKINLKGIDWVIVGGESGAGCRPMQPEWARSLRDQCLAAEVPFFFKQWGGFPKVRAGRELDGRTWDEFPDYSNRNLTWRARVFPGSSHLKWSAIFARNIVLKNSISDQMDDAYHVARANRALLWLSRQLPAATVREVNSE